MLPRFPILERLESPPRLVSARFGKGAPCLFEGIGLLVAHDRVCFSAADLREPTRANLRRGAGEEIEIIYKLPGAYQART